jgi:transcriptional regulator with PAS, ATPase and Fis domain
MQGVIERARAAARSDAGVLIQGESGTGKEVLARAIHDEGPRAAGPFVPISCGVLAESLLEAELFGHEKGAFTGAGAARPGRFERAHGGTVFLDDIDDMPKATQVKLLRVLQEHEIERVGGGEPVPVDIRIIAASKEDLGRMVSAGEFREDLYYRLNIITLNLPPLRKRPEDIPHLVAGFIARHADGAEYVVPPQTMERVQSAPWPGNVRQLENAVLRAIALSPTGTGELAAEHLVCGDAAEAPARPVPTLAEATAAAQHEAIDSALAASGGNRTRAAELLDISRKHLWELMKKREG